MAKTSLPINQPAEVNDDYTDKADELSLKIYHLKNIVYLAAFAAESRRVLEGISEATGHLPEMEKVIHENVEYSNHWVGRTDVASSVLEWVAEQMDEFNTDMTGSIYKMARGERVSPVA